MVTFAPKVDLWLAVVIASAPLIALGVAVAASLTGDVAAIVAGWATLLGVVALYAAVVWPLAYEVGEDSLVIRFGLMRTRVPYEDITRIRPSRNILASPALSLDRLRIDRRCGGFLPIAPDDRAGFIGAVQARAPHVAVEARR
ncbi:MAG: hypothetical protein GEU80_16565 [Dehalococcoidia bacterium]|nr:hypothetical protein [Dehalococcoidia bacterium]